MSIYDQNKTSAEDQKKILAYKEAWAAANKAGDKAGMDSAHKAAEAVRANYNYSGGSWGNQYNPLEAKAPVQAAPVQAAPVMPTLPQPVDNSAAIQAIFDRQNAAQTAALHGARDQANSDYQEKIDNAPKEFQPHRDQVDMNTTRGVQHANEVAAAKGIAFSGGVQSDQGGMFSAGEAQKTALTQQEIGLVQSLKKAIADNNRATSFKEIEMTANNQSQMQQALIGENNRLYEGQYRAATDSFNQGVNVAGLTGYYNGQRTIQGQQMDTGNEQWQKSFDQSSTQWQKSFDQSSTQWKEQMDFTKDRAKIADGQWLTSFQADQKNAAAGRAIQWGNLNLDKAKFDWAKDPSNPNNIINASDGSANYKKSLATVLDFMGQTKKVVDQETGGIKEVSKNSKSQVFDMIYNDPSLSEDEKLAMLAQLGYKK